MPPFFFYDRESDLPLTANGIFVIRQESHRCSVSKKLWELGIRIALGGQRKEVLQAAWGRAFELLALGSAAGLVLGILASRVLASIVYQASPRDPVVLAGVVLATSMLGLLATWIPAQTRAGSESFGVAARRLDCGSRD